MASSSAAAAKRTVKRPAAIQLAPPPKKARSDDELADAWPVDPCCLKCAKRLMLVFDHRCTTKPSSRVCNTCKDQNDGCDKVG
jgi:hypothetical protein